MIRRKKFGQFSMSLTYPGVIKAFHYHHITTESYQSAQPDEYRIPWNSPEIGFNWETQNR